MTTQADVIAKAQLDAQTINSNFEYLSTVKADTTSIGTANLTIKKNNTALGTFSANATSALEVNISVPTTVAELSDSSDYAKKSDIGSVIIPKGSSAFASLPSPGSSNLGYMYNVTDSFTTTSDFVEGSGKKYPAGTNVYVVDAGSSTYKWDVLQGFINTDTYDTHIADTTIHVTATEHAKLTSITSATTLAGYGITDAYTKTETDAYLASCFSTTIVPLGTSV